MLTIGHFIHFLAIFIAFRVSMFADSVFILCVTS